MLLSKNKLKKVIYKHKPKTVHRLVNNVIPNVPNFVPDQEIQSLAFLSSNTLARQLSYEMDWKFHVDVQIFSEYSIRTYVHFDFRKCGRLHRIGRIDELKHFVLGSNGTEMEIDNFLMEHGYTRGLFDALWTFSKVRTYNKRIPPIRRICKRYAIADAEDIIKKTCRYLRYSEPAIVLVNSTTPYATTDKNLYKICVSNIPLNANTDISKSIVRVASHRSKNNMNAVPRPAQRMRRRSF